MIDHIDAYAIPVRNLEKCISFYRDKIGMKLQQEQEGFAYLVFNRQDKPGIALVTMGNAVNLISEKQVRPKEETIHRTYFAVFVDDVDKEYAKLRSKGVHFIKRPATRPWGQRIAYFEDPEGNLWEISTLLDR